MNPKLLRLVLAATLFAAWMCYLGYLVYGRPRSPNELPIELSRPQFLVSEMDVVGVIDDKNGQVTVKEVLYPKENAPVEKDATIKVVNLDKVRILVKKMSDDQLEHWEEQKPASLENPASLGSCLLALRHTLDGTAYEVVPLPRSPGILFVAPRIYPATPETLAEYRAIHKP